jgi:hypothetical protein
MGIIGSRRVSDFSFELNIVFVAVSDQPSAIRFPVRRKLAADG